MRLRARPRVRSWRRNCGSLARANSALICAGVLGTCYLKERFDKFFVVGNNKSDDLALNAGKICTGERRLDRRLWCITGKRKNEVRDRECSAEQRVVFQDLGRGGLTQFFKPVRYMSVWGDGRPSYSRNFVTASAIALLYKPIRLLDSPLSKASSPPSALRRNPIRSSPRIAVLRPSFHWSRLIGITNGNDEFTYSVASISPISPDRAITVVGRR